MSDIFPLHSIDESLEFPGYTLANHRAPDDCEGDIFIAQAAKLRDKYEADGYEVLHVLSYANSGIDFFTMKQVRPNTSGFEVVYK